MGGWDCLAGARNGGGAVLAALLLLFGLGQTASAEDQPRRGGTAIFTLGADPPLLSPILSTGIPEGLIGCILYEGLTRVSTAEGIQPMLAKSWTISPMSSWMWSVVISCIRVKYGIRVLEMFRASPVR